ncbi:rluB [Symbiodinium natans]|uniref:RluB protein n=1 Tax=Symbiodinium natans TaxID=878477 RepID=A0A812R9W0_9DINO|nr:rluB [Symbiodinium natans]
MRDRDSEGLLLLTTDGHFTHFVTAPEKSFEKEYVALTCCAKDGAPPSKECLSRLVEGIELSDGHVAKALAAEVVAFDGRFARLRIVVTEGRFRMVRRMLRGCGYCCMQLLRVRTCGIGSAALRPPSLQEAAFEANHKVSPSVAPASAARDPERLFPGEFAAVTPAEVADIYRECLAKVPRNRGATSWSTP